MAGILLIINPGDKFGDLTIVKETDREFSPNGLSRRMFFVDCICGKRFKLPLYYLTREYKQTSCGCVKNGRTLEARKIRNLAITRWAGIRDYQIKIRNDWPKKWENFDGFVEDMGISTLHLKRIDPKLPYSKDNCYWDETSGRQRLIEYKGEIKNISHWAKELGITRERLRQRLNKYPIEKAMDVKKNDKP